jgi:histidyl-tRNA synthetase
MPEGSDQIAELLRPEAIRVALPGADKAAVLDAVINLLAPLPEVRDIETVRRRRARPRGADVHRRGQGPRAPARSQQRRPLDRHRLRDHADARSTSTRSTASRSSCCSSSSGRRPRAAGTSSCSGRISRLMSNATSSASPPRGRRPDDVLAQFARARRPSSPDRSLGTPARPVTPTAMNLQRIKGTFDVLPEAYDLGGTTVFGTAAWRHVEAVVRGVLERFNFQEIRTPLLEPTELVARGVGRRRTSSRRRCSRSAGGYGLRAAPEVTAPVMRAYQEHHLDQRGGVQKLYYLGPCFRAEQPQKGRYRQFHQFGTETLGTDDPAADAETIACMMAVYDAFAITNVRLRLNTLGEPESRARYRDALVAFLAPHARQLSETSRQRLETNPLRILDTKLEGEQRPAGGGPPAGGLRDGRGPRTLRRGQGPTHGPRHPLRGGPRPRARARLLHPHGVRAREPRTSGAQSALAGGGRYDGLAEAIGGRQPVPAVGFAAGIERLFVALEAPAPRSPNREPAAGVLRRARDDAEPRGLPAGASLRQRGPPRAWTCAAARSRRRCAKRTASGPTLP